MKDARDSVRPLEKFSYASTVFGHGAVSGAVSLLLLYYYTDVVMLPTEAVTVMLLAVRLFDGAVDPFIGHHIDRHTTRRGKYRGYLIYWGAPFCALSALMFLPVEMANIGAKVVWYGLVYLAWSFVSSMIECASLPLLVAISGDPKERYGVNMAKILGGILATLAARYGVLELVKLLGNGSERVGYALTMGLFAGIGFFCMFFPARWIQERNKLENSSISLPRTALLLLGDRRIAFMLLFVLSQQMASSIKGQASVYYMKYIVDRPDLTSIFLLTGIVSSLAMQPVIFLATKRLSIRLLIPAGFFGSAASMLLMGFAGPSVGLLLAGNALYGIASAFPANLLYIYTAELADDLPGNASATLHSFLGVTARIALSVAGTLVSLILLISDYTPNTAQAADARFGIQFAFIATTTLLYFAACGFSVLSFRSRSQR